MCCCVVQPLWLEFLSQCLYIYICHCIIGEREQGKTCNYVNPTPRPGCNGTTNGQRQERLQRQQRRLAAETAQEREQRLRQHSDNQQRRLAAETAQKREQRLRQLSANQQRRLAAETAQEREQRLRQLSDNQQCRLAAEAAQERRASKTTL